MRYVLTDVAEEAARQSGFIRGQRKLSGAAFAVRRWALAEALEKPRRLAGVLWSIGRCLSVGRRVDKRRKEPDTAQQLLAPSSGRKEVAVA
jgi:hypothetical protein